MFFIEVLIERKENNTKLRVILLNTLNSVSVGEKTSVGQEGPNRKDERKGSKTRLH